jgi:hypothetical protein
MLAYDSDMTPRRRWLPAIMGSLLALATAAVTAAFILASLNMSLQNLGVRDSYVEAVNVILGPMLCIGVAGVGIACVMLQLRDQRDEWRAVNARCPHCGYYLRGILDKSPTCPECGRPFKSIHRPDPPL